MKLRTIREAQSDTYKVKSGGNNVLEGEHVPSLPPTMYKISNLILFKAWLSLLHENIDTAATVVWRFCIKISVEYSNYYCTPINSFVYFQTMTLGRLCRLSPPVRSPRKLSRKRENDATISGESLKNPSIFFNCSKVMLLWFWWGKLLLII